MGSILCLIGQIYMYILFGRVIISFIFLFRPDWRPPAGLRPVLDLIYAATDPPVNFLRRFIPPLRSGAVALDLAFLVWFLIVAYVLRPALCSI
jgi:YggT family protein